jgi:beta-RFAP synthase
MKHRGIEVVAPSRLHFGLLSFGGGADRQFGGAGAMIDSPGLRLRVAPAERFHADGPLAERVFRTAISFARARELSAPPNCRVEVVVAPPEHIGLGTGTQLDLAILAGLNAFVGGVRLSADELARIAGRAGRSAVGTHGFVHGGLIVESGKRACETLAPLTERIELPAAWRFVLVIPRHMRGLSGEEERRAFDALPPVPAATRDALERLLIDQLCPAVRSGDFERFAESVYHYGYTAGMSFAARQGGPFASARVAELVDGIRSLGVQGVGQSSWGPTVFAAVPSIDAAEQLCDRLHGQSGDESLVVARPNNSGARIVGSG